MNNSIVLKSSVRSVFVGMISVSMACNAIVGTSISTVSALEKIVQKKNSFRVETVIKKPNNTGITFLKHDNNKSYVLKQRFSEIPSRHMTALRDALGSLVALKSDIPANCAIIIARGCAFPGKHSTLFPASLHEVVPGVRVDRLPVSERLPRGYIQQHLRKCEVYGLTRDIIKNMSSHKDLCRIVAFDTFIANGDRHTGNLFYDITDDRYYAIDLASSFKHQAACYACDLIASMLRDKKCSLSKKEILGLSTYRDTLKKLIECHSSGSLYQYMVDYAKQGDFMSCPGISRRVEESKTIIKKNYESCQKLLILLNSLIKKQHTRLSR